MFWMGGRCIGLQFSFIYIINQISTFLTSIIDRMQNGIARRQQIFRNSIRQQQIETYKKNRRKQLIQYDQQITQQHDTYWKILDYHSLDQLSAMSSEMLSNHMQMLFQIVFSMDSIYKDCFEKILTVLIDFYQQAQKGWNNQFINKISQINHSRDNLELQQINEAYTLTQIFSFIPPNMFFKLVAGVYYDINPYNNIIYLRKALRIVKNVLNFSFTDSQTIKGLLHSKLTEQFDFRLNKTINKNVLLTIIMNISASEQDEVIQILKQELIFERLCNSLELYGMNIENLQVLSAIYANSIDYLCQSVHESPIKAEHQFIDESETNTTDFLYLPLFAQFTNLLDNRLIMQRMIYISKCLLEAAVQNKLHCREMLLEQTELIIRQIIMQDQYLPFCQHLFIIFANEYNINSAIWLAQFLKVILKGHLQLYYDSNAGKQKHKMQIQQKKSKKQIPIDLNNLLKACQTLLTRSQETDLDFQQFLVGELFQFWCNEQVIMGYEELIAFMQIGIDHNRDLAHFIILDKFQHQFVSFLLTDCQPLNQILSILGLIDSTCERLFELELSIRNNYIRSNLENWQNILHMVQGYSMNKQIENGQNFNICMSIYEKVEKLIEQVTKQSQ